MRSSDPSGDDQETTDSEGSGTSTDTGGVDTGTTNEDASHPRTDTGTTNEDASHPRTDTGTTNEDASHPRTDTGNTNEDASHPRTDTVNKVPFHKLGGDQGQSQETRKDQQENSTNPEESQRRVLYFGFAAVCIAAIVTAPAGNVGAVVSGSAACGKLFQEAGNQAGALSACFGKYGGLSPSGLESGLKTCVLNFAP
ncbi:hypothetical protein [Streptomyces xanthophaeus]|uniref:hypothetical protein n=1 Tax=Streptomyces xanthophaeus TaxID=67385 RepID=UPI00364F106E